MSCRIEVRMRVIGVIGATGISDTRMIGIGFTIEVVMDIGEPYHA